MRMAAERRKKGKLENLRPPPLASLQQDVERPTSTGEFVYVMSKKM
jgi:hypothetical protein